MELRRAILCHAILVSIQPIHFGLQWTLNREYLSSTSPARLTLALVIWICIVAKITIPFVKFPLRHLPSPSGDTFPIGHAWKLRDEQPPVRITNACRETPNEGVIAFWDPLYIRARIILTSPEAVMEVINSHSYDWEKPGPAKKLLGRVLGQGLVNVEGNMHKAMRKSVTPAFSGRQIRALVPLFWSKGLAFADSMARELRNSSNGELEMMGQMSRVTLDIIGAAGIGMDFDTINGDDNKLAKLYATITSTNRGPIIPFFLINVLLPPWFVRKMYGTVYARVANATQELRRSIRELLVQKKENVKQNSAGHTDIIATILQSGDFSDEYLCDQLLTFFAAGHDTTASALTWTMWLLALHPDVQDRLRKECREFLSGHPAEKITADIFDGIPYLTAVCNETLRLYPTVPMTARHAVVDTKIGNLHIPKGMVALISPWIINRHLGLWGQDAEKYRPDRWLQGHLASSGGAKNAYAFLTFLYGPRSCIGQNFARTEMRCLLAALILRFEFAPSASGEEVKIGGFITIKPKGGLKLRLRDLSAGVLEEGAVKD